MRNEEIRARIVAGLAPILWNIIEPNVPRKRGQNMPDETIAIIGKIGRQFREQLRDVAQSLYDHEHQDDPADYLDPIDREIAQMLHSVSHEISQKYSRVIPTKANGVHREKSCDALS